MRRTCRLHVEKMASLRRAAAPVQKAASERPQWVESERSNQRGFVLAQVEVVAVEISRSRQLALMTAAEKTAIQSIIRITADSIQHPASASCRRADLR